MPLVGQGGKHTWPGYIRDGALVLSDPATLQLTVRDGLGIVQPGFPVELTDGTTPGTIIRDDTGVYHFDWVTASDQAEGTYTATWGGILNGAAIAGSDTVDVVGAGTITPSPATPHWTYDLATSVGQVRLNIDDRDFSVVGALIPPRRRSCIFTDEEVQTFLDDTHVGGDVRFASAVALIVIAGNKQLLVQSRRIGNTQVDFGNVRRDLMAQAAALVGGEEQLAILMAPAPADAIVEQTWTDFSYRQIVENAAIRQAG